MKTLVIKALDTAIGNFPLSDKHSIELIKKGDGTGTLTLSIRARAAAVITIKGGVFINDLEEESNSLSLPASSLDYTSTRVRVVDENAYIYVPNTVLWTFRQVWPNPYGQNLPVIKYGSSDLYNLDSLSNMFQGATSFNDDISNWDVSTATNLGSVFSGARTFNRNIGAWDTSLATITSSMFLNATSFNQDISNWNVSSVTGMNSMFAGATAFNQDISAWTFNLNANLDNFMNNKSNYNPIFYDALLQNLASRSWAGRTTAKTLGMGTNKYTAAGAAHRATLVNDGWTITDGGLV